MNDDRRTCEQCANLERAQPADYYTKPGKDGSRFFVMGTRRCVAARRGELSDVARDYSPVINIPRRCGQFAAMDTA